MSYRMSFILPITKLILTSSMKITPYTVKYKINLFSKVFFFATVSESGNISVSGHYPAKVNFVLISEICT